MRLSIVICTHRRPKLLQLAVQSLCHQTSSRESTEIIVVDNDIISNKEVVDIVEENKALINIKYIHEPVLGLSTARNTGGKAAIAEYVGYIDDDAKAKENYIEVLLKLIDTNLYDIIGGPYYPFFLDPKPKWFQDNYESCDSGVTRLFNRNEFLNGTNMVYRKSLLFDINWYDSSFGMSGRQIAYGEETNIQMRLWQKFDSLKVFYSSDLIVYHYVPPFKMTLKDKFRRSYKIGKSQAFLWIPEDQVRSAQRKAPFIILKTFIYFILKEIPGFFFRDKKKYRYWQNYAFEVFSQQFASFGQNMKYMKNLIK